MHAGGHPHGVWARSGTTLNAFFGCWVGGCLLLWGTVQVVCLGAACKEVGNADCGATQHCLATSCVLEHCAMISAFAIHTAGCGGRLYFAALVGFVGATWRWCLAALVLAAHNTSLSHSCWWGVEGWSTPYAPLPLRFVWREPSALLHCWVQTCQQNTLCSE
jgi:hypothetical protein